jgi:hypothetical protein
MKRALQILIYKKMINGEQHLFPLKIKFKQMKRALQILIYKKMINGEQHLFPLKNKI